MSAISLPLVSAISVCLPLMSAISACLPLVPAISARLPLVPAYRQRSNQGKRDGMKSPSARFRFLAAWTIAVADDPVLITAGDGKFCAWVYMWLGE